MSPTRRDFLVTSAAAAVGAAFGRPLPAAAWLQAQALPVFTPIRRNVGTFTMRGGTVGWLVNAGGVAVVDTQFPAEARALIAGLQARATTAARTRAATQSSPSSTPTSCTWAT